MKKGKQDVRKDLYPQRFLYPFHPPCFFYSMSLLCVGPFSSKMFSSIWTSIMSKFFFSPRDKIRATHLKSLSCVSRDKITHEAPSLMYFFISVSLLLPSFPLPSFYPSGTTRHKASIWHNMAWVGHNNPHKYIFARIDPWVTNRSCWLSFNDDPPSLIVISSAFCTWC